MSRSTYVDFSVRIFPSAHFPSTGHKIILMEEKDYHKVCVKMVKRNKGEGG